MTHENDKDSPVSEALEEREEGDEEQAKAGRRRRMSPERLVRQWRLVTLLSQARRGKTAASLQEALGVTRATFYRDLNVLLDAGIQIDKQVVGGEVRHALVLDVAPVMPSREQVLALLVSSQLLSPLQGTALYRALDGLISRWRPVEQMGVRLLGSIGDDEKYSEHNRVFDQAVRQRRLVRMLYRSSKELEAQWRTVAPREARLMDGKEVYWVCYDSVDEKDKNYKLTRVKEVRIGGGQKGVPVFDAAGFGKNALGVWEGEEIDVVLLVSAALLRFVEEGPLPQQRVVVSDDGSAVVCATVTGDREILRWVLRWGRGVEVLSPPSLRDAVVAELGAALSAYSEDRGVSTM